MPGDTKVPFPSPLNPFMLLTVMASMILFLGSSTTLNIEIAWFLYTSSVFSLTGISSKAFLPIHFLIH